MKADSNSQSRHGSGAGDLSSKHGHGELISETPVALGSDDLIPLLERLNCEPKVTCLFPVIFIL